ncbi:MAG: COX15/CtaA family protein [Acidobacteriota bacterium]
MRLDRFAIYVWGVLAYNLAVIVWGAYVRSTGSGAGCGSHWPLCNGEVIPTTPHIKTLIEFTHRFTSGLALLLVVGMLIWAFRIYQRKHPVRIGAVLSILFIFTEALIGAGLVIFELVAENRSIARALSISAHLINTFLLIAALTLTAWWASGGQHWQLRARKPAALTLGLSLLGILILGVSGAVAALGDTLFPASSLTQALQQDLSPTAHFLIRLRLLHPIIAIISITFSICTLFFVQLRYSTVWTTRFAYAFLSLSLFQLGVGALNVYWLAPIWLQLVHLLIADICWILLVLLTAAALANPATQETNLARASHSSAVLPAH